MTYDKNSRYSPQILYRLIHDIYVFMDIADAAILSRFGLTTLQYNGLSILDHDGEQQLVELANRLLVTRSTITRMIDELEARRWVARRDDPADRRAQRVSLTADGRSLLAQARAAHYGSLEKRFEGIDGAQRDFLIQLLETLRASTQSFAENPQEVIAPDISSPVQK